MTTGHIKPSVKSVESVSSPVTHPPSSVLRPSSKEETLALNPLTNDEYQRWDNYVRNSANGLPLHLSGWCDVMHNTYNYQTRYIMAQDQERIVGVMPLFLVPSLLTGRRAMTMPGGICANDDTITAKLIDQAVRTAEAENIDKILLQDSRTELPHNWPLVFPALPATPAPPVIPAQARIHSRNPKNWLTESNHVYWVVDLGQSEEALWKRLDGNIRRQVRKARQNELTVKIDRSGELMKPFYDIFSRFTHQAGTPVFGLPFLENTINAFPNGFNIAVVWFNEQPVAGYFQLEMNDTIYGMWGAALPETLKLRPAYLALWEIMRDAIDQGYAFLDMGRSPAESNASKFKGQWGGTSHPIFQTIINNNEKKPARSVTGQVQSSDQFQLFMKIWPKLPLSFTKFVGPKLRWHVPFA